MASRTSMFTQALRLPEWVTGGEYGDLSNIMNKRDIQYENVAQEEQGTAFNEMKLDEARRQEDYRQQLGDMLSQGERPTTLRDLYKVMATAAGETGNPMEIADIQGKIDALDRAELSRKAYILNQLDNLPYGVLKDIYGNDMPVDEKTANSIYGRRRQGKERFIEVFDFEKNFIRNVPESEAEIGQAGGKMIRTDDPRLKNGDIEIKPFNGRGLPVDDGQVPGAKPPFTLFRKDGAPSGVQDGRGDRARGEPSVGDQVDTIIKKRQVMRG